MKSSSAAVMIRRPRRGVACGLEINGAVDEAEGDTENLRNRPHCLPLEIKVHRPFLWVERVRANYSSLRRGDVV